MDRKAQIIEYINNNLGEHLTLEGLCEHFHTNRTTLARLIKEATGKSPIRYILEERLRRSRAELEEGELLVVLIYCADKIDKNHKEIADMGAENPQSSGGKSLTSLGNKGIACGRNEGAGNTDNSGH